MEMIPHEAVGDDLNAKLPGIPAHLIQESIPVAIINENKASFDAARHDVIHRARVMNPMFSWHTYHTIEAGE